MDSTDSSRTNSENEGVDKEGEAENNTKDKITAKNLQNLSSSIEPVRDEGPSENVPDSVLTVLGNDPTPEHSTSEERSAEQILIDLNYELEEEIGRGTFGKVYKITRTTDSAALAAKVIDISAKRERRLNDLKYELFVFKKITHPHIVKMHDHFLIDTHFYIIMDFADSGNLSSYVRRKGMVSERRAKRWFEQFASAIHHMHCIGIAHRDLKLGNILLHKNIERRKDSRVTDFGLSRLGYHRKHGVLLSNAYCGTGAYMAPEILDKPDGQSRRFYDPLKADVWALGVCLYCLVCRAYPFQYFNDDQVVVRHMKERKYKFRARAKRPLSENLKNLIGNLLEPDPDKRITFYGIFLHRWLKNSSSEVGKAGETLVVTSNGPQ